MPSLDIFVNQESSSFDTTLLQEKTLMHKLEENLFSYFLIAIVVHRSVYIATLYNKYYPNKTAKQLTKTTLPYPIIGSSDAATLDGTSNEGSIL